MKRRTFWERFFFLSLPVGMALVMLASCKPSVPNEYIQPDDMEDILYDYHIANGMASSTSGQNGMELTYQTAVLRKHGVTKAEFDSSMVYYMRNTSRLHAIYENLSKRLEEEAKSLGTSANDLARYGGITSVGDTASVWKGEKFIVLTTQAPFNYAPFTIPCDTTYHPGDQLNLDFDAQFIFQSGMRDGIVVLAMTLGNDSVFTRNARINSNSHYSLQITDEMFRGIKAIKGYFLLSTGFTNRNSTTMKMMFVENIRLVRMHRKKNMLITSEKVDSLRKDSGMANPSPHATPRTISTGIPNAHLTEKNGMPPKERLNHPAQLKLK